MSTSAPWERPSLLSHFIRRDMSSPSPPSSPSSPLSSPLYTITDEAYLKCVLHSAKYVSAVAGIFLGRFVSTTSGDGTTTQLVDCLPLAHSGAAIFTSATAEIALLLARKLAARRGLAIVGFYYGNELADDRSIGVVPTRLADHIRSDSDSAVLLMIDAPKLAPDRRRTVHPFRVCARRDSHTSTWGKAELPDDSLYVPEKLLEACDDLLSETNPARYTITDFEDHCLDPKNCDWLNPHVKPLDRALPVQEKEKEERGAGEDEGKKES